MAGKGRPGPAPRLRADEKVVPVSVSLPRGMVKRLQVIAGDRSVSGLIRDFVEPALAEREQRDPESAS